MGQLSIEYRPLADLLAQRWVENPKDHDLGLIHQSIDEHGFNDPVTLGRVGKQEMLVEGHGRLECLEQKRAAGSPAPAHIRVNGKGWEVPVNIGVEFPTMQKAKKYALQHNRLTEMGGYLDDKLLAALKEQADDLDGIGWDDDDLHALGIGIEPQPEAPDAQIDRAAELQKKWKTETGQLWALGAHRLLCGDSTKREDVDRVMGGDKARLVWTDPPYGVKYGDKLDEHNAQGYKVRTIQNDDLPSDKLEEFIRGAYRNAAAYCSPGAAIYATCPAGDQLISSMLAFKGSGFDFRWQLVWLKDALVLGRGDYHFRHENILYGWKPDGAHYFTDSRKHDSIFEFPRPKASEFHPTMKPVELIEAMVCNSSERGDVVYEPFSGSGSTMLACERQGRKCRAIEISPAYVAVALQRWADMTGKKPELVK